MNQVVADRVRVTVLSAPLDGDEAVPMAFGRLADRRACLVEIEADGIVGLGESWINYPAWAPQERLATLCEGAAPLLLGRDVANPRLVLEDLAERLLPIGRQWGALGPIWQALSGVDLALWDLRGKLDDKSVAELLHDASAGPFRSRIPAYASGVGPTHVVPLCEAALEAGLSSVKTKVGFGRERDSSTLREARSVLGGSPSLFADANQAWDLAEAKAMSDLLNQHGVAWIEEPLVGDDLGELEKLSAQTSIALATGENLYGLSNFNRYVESAAIHTIQPDLTKSGGFTTAAHVAERASRAATAVAPHCYGGAIGIAASLQLGAAFPSVQLVELDVRDNPLRTELLTTPLRLDAGDLVVPDGPGLGVELDSDVVRNRTIHWDERTRRDI